MKRRAGRARCSQTLARFTKWRHVVPRESSTQGTFVHRTERERLAAAGHYLRLRCIPLANPRTHATSRLTVFQRRSSAVQHSARPIAKIANGFAVNAD